MEHIKELVSLTMTKVEILKLKADHHDWCCYVDSETKKQLEESLTEIDKLLAKLRAKKLPVSKQASFSMGKQEITPSDVINLYNNFFTKRNVTQSQKPSKKLLTRITACIRTEFETLSEWKSYFELIEMSDFLMGKIPPSNGYNRQFRLDIDYVVNDSNISKILERRI